ncbi:response regulator [Pigmentibacter sp. JX0631]|uniref:response regulator n=1 Tax=Pigmentibacter sp. JX0631 TaxID=2976982 RepID=UPI0024684875|nr:response regulator [Pigmentibacter sp. JX0631]WGL59161.1 response regulator [Pigmentibacter sp. JX0631]
MSCLKEHLILVVDDEPDLREMLVSELQTLEAKTLEAGNGKEGIKIVKNEKIDLIISDIRMPGGNGIDLLDETKKLNLLKPKFLFITAFSDFTREEIHAHGAEGLVSKPFDLPSLIENLEWLCTDLKTKYLKKPVQPTSTRLQVSANNANEFILGRGGALMYTGTKLLEAAEFVEFEIQFPDGTKVTGNGEVLWNGNVQDGENYCAGIEFKYFTPDCLDYAIKLIESCKSIAYVPERTKKIE